MKKITWKNYDELVPFFKERTEVLKFASLPTFLIAHNYEFEIENEVAFIYRRGSFLGKPFFFLGFPPLSLHQDIDLEARLLKAVLATTHAVLSKQELVTYGISEANYRVSLKEKECVYPLAQYLKLEGKDWHKWRVAVNSAKRDYNIVIQSEINNSLLKELVDLTKQWTLMHKCYPKINQFLEDFNRKRLKDARLLYFRRDGVIKYYMITQPIGKTTGFICDMKSIETNASYSLSKTAIVFMANYWYDYGIKYLNIGMSRNKGIKKAKELLRPEQLRLYRIKSK